MIIGIFEFGVFVYRGDDFLSPHPSKICDDNLGGFSRRSMIQFCGRG